MKKELLERIAPCSLMCHTCSAYDKGVICEHAQELQKYLTGIKEFYQKNIPEAAAQYHCFEEELEKYASGSCSGCRSGKNNICSIENCFILSCTNEHGVNFCGECREFPCQKTTLLFTEEVYRRWLTGNRQIRDEGIETFWEKNRQKGHYEGYR